MRAVVVGAGAWGLPAAAELARRGHDVTLVEAYSLGHTLGSSSGESRLWRLTHPEPLQVRLAQRAVESWRRVEERTGTELLLRHGLLWRGDSAGAVAAALAAESVPCVQVDEQDVGRFFPGLRPNGAAAVWQQDAGPVLAAKALRAHAALLEQAGGRILAGLRVTAVDVGGPGVRLQLSGGQDPLEADVAVLAAGPWSGDLLAGLGVDLLLQPVLEQVAYLAVRPGWPEPPCLYDGATQHDAGLYAMPTPGLGYKIGLDQPLRAFAVDDLDRTPDAERDRATERRVARDFAVLQPRVLSSQVCTWTMSPDGEFIIDRLHDGRVVLACGDSGTGFKFSALLGEILADHAEGRPVGADVESFGLRRFAEVPRPTPAYGVFGRPGPATGPAASA